MCIRDSAQLEYCLRQFFLALQFLLVQRLVHLLQMLDVLGEVRDLLLVLGLLLEGRRVGLYELTLNLEHILGLVAHLALQLLDLLCKLNILIGAQLLGQFSCFQLLLDFSKIVLRSRYLCRQGLSFAALVDDSCWPLRLLNLLLDSQLVQFALGGQEFLPE